MARRGANSPLGAVGEARRLGAPATSAPGAVRGWLGRAPQVARGHPPQRPASRGSNLPPARARLDGAGCVCSSGCVPWTWSAALAVPKAPCGSSPPSLAGLSCSLSWRRLLSPLKLAAAPSPLALARLEPGRFVWSSASTPRDEGGVRASPKVEVRPLGLTPWPLSRWQRCEISYPYLSAECLRLLG